MPLKPLRGVLYPKIECQQDVLDLFEEGLRLARNPSPSKRESATRDIADCFYYIGVVYPSFALPLQYRFTHLTDDELRAFNFTFETWLYLLDGAGDSCTEWLAVSLRERPEHWKRWWMLAAIGTPAALTALGDLARNHNWTQDLQNLGFETPPLTGPACPRFTRRRTAIKVVPFEGDLQEWLRQPHPVGLPVSAVADISALVVVRWHYLSISTAALEGMPHMDVERLHLVSPALNWGWTLSCELLDDGRLTNPFVSLQEGEEDDPENNAALAQGDDERSQPLTVAELLPLDDHLIYCNSHVMLTENVEGHVGGPPIGLYPNPMCRECGRLMFHVLTVGCHINEYGDGWRSLFLCERCRTTACNATSWN